MIDDTPARSATTSRDYAVALGRAFAGAVIFGLPLLMTMEMWGLGHALSPLMLLQFSLANMVMLFGLSKVAGFEESHRSLDDVLDALAAYAVGALVSACWSRSTVRPSPRRAAPHPKSFRLCSTIWPGSTGSSCWAS